MERADKLANRLYSDAYRGDDRTRAGSEASKRHALELIVPWLADRLEPGATLVDIAGGAGTYASALVRAAPVSVVGLDISEELVRIRNGDPLLPENVVGDMERLPFASERFDAALFVACLHHVPDPLPALQEASRVLRPGGQLFAFEPVSLKAGLGAPRAIRGNPHEFRLARTTLTARVRDAGFEIVEERGRRLAVRSLRPLLRRPPLWALHACDRVDRALSALGLDGLGEVVVLRAVKPAQ